MQDISMDTNQEKPSILKLMVDYPEEVKDTIDLLQNEIKTPAKQIAPQSVSEDAGRQFSSLSNLLNDTRVRQMVNDIAGENVVTIINTTLGTIDSNCSAEVKRQAFEKGIQKVQTNLKNLDTLRENQSFNFAASLIGLDERKLKSLQAVSSNKWSY